MWQLAYRVGFAAARRWWQFRRPNHEGALVAIYVGRAILLVRSSYRRAWNFPGGGVQADETPMSAAKRELLEEIGLEVPALRFRCRLSGLYDGRRDRVYIFELDLDRLPRLRLDYREIIETRLVPISEWREMNLTEPVAAYLQATSEMHTPNSRVNNADLE
jgi:8-oxo-dGTP diphosphatase